MKKILIVKMGLSETLDGEKSKVVSLGDIIRCTVILEPLKQKYAESSITWVVSQQGFPLVDGNKFIDKALVWDEFLPFLLMRERYDMVINLEKISGICALVEMINAWERVGFRLNADTGEYDTYLQSSLLKEYINRKDYSSSRTIWQPILLEMLGLKWEGQRYSLGYKPTGDVKYDVGLNWRVGGKWPIKTMREDRWHELYEILSNNGYSVSWQEGTGDLYEYFEWINKCKIIVTADSLGLHLALALKKKVVAIFGPTDPNEVYFYDEGSYVLPSKNFTCLGCYKSKCDNNEFCLDYIDLENIVSEVKNSAY